MKKNLLFLCAAMMAILTLAAEMKVLAFAGSTRTDSYNEKLVHDAAEMAKKMGAAVTVINLRDYPMPFYNADMESKEGIPQNAKRLRELIISHDGIIIASPEYNSSISALLKNAVDWASRKEEGSSVKAFKGKKVAIMSTSPGKHGGSRALAHLRTIMEDVGAQVISKQVAIPDAHQYFSKERVENALLKEAIQELLQAS